MLTRLSFLFCAVLAASCASSTPSWKRPVRKTDAVMNDFSRDVPEPVPAFDVPARQLPAQSGTPRTPSLTTRLYATELHAFRVEDEPSLRAVMERIAAQSGLSIFVQPVAEEAVADEGFTFELDWPRPVAVGKLLDMITELADGTIGWEVRHGLVFVTTPERLRPTPKTRVYDISDLLNGPQSFAGPEIAVSPSGGIVGADEELATPRAVIDEDLLIELIMATIEPGTWDDERSSIRIENGKLIVTR